MSMTAIASVGAVTASAPANPPAAPATQSGSSAPSGSWTLVPGLLEVKWDYDSTKDEVDISVTFLWWTIGSLTGMLSSAQFDLKDNINLLGLIQGSLEISAVYSVVAGGDAPGLWISGNEDVFGKDWTFKNHLLSW